MKAVLRLLLVFAVLYAAYLVLLYVRQRHIVFPAWGQQYPTVTLPQGTQKLTVEHAEGTSYGYFHPASTRGPAVVVTHGNGSIAEDMFAIAKFYQAWGFSTLVPEYRGFQGADGEPSQEGITEDVLAMIREMKQHPNVDPDRILYHGISLGGGVAGSVTAIEPPYALILESTFTSVPDMASRFFAPGFLVRDPFDTNTVLRSFDGPTLILHGTQDPVVPVTHARRNSETAKKQKLVIFANAGHQLLTPQTLPIWKSAVRGFLDENGLTSQSSDESASP